MQGNAKAVQDRMVSDSQGKTMETVSSEGAINCLCLNKDSSQVVVAGRSVFKVYGIEDEKFVERINLRQAGRINLNYSASDVVWNHADENVLASAATNGAVVTWNLSKSSRTKQDRVFTDHRRTVHRVIFHKNEHQLLMSGAQDGFMKIFDLRSGSCTTTFDGKGVSVRDIQFNPHHYFLFAAGYENGTVQIWDMRIPTKWERQFTAHSDPVYAVDFHPEEKNWIATAGRDKMIKVWDTSSSSKVKNNYNIQCITSVSRIKWRPQRRFHIASCALLVDFSINVWDVRRPYIPFASFNEHKDVVTGIEWKHNDAHVFYSCGKDSTLIQHMFKDANRPADSANPIGIDVSVGGDIAHASSDKLLSDAFGSKTNYSQSKFPAFFRKGPDRTEQFPVTSILSEFQNKEECLSMEWFYQSAKRYKLTGKSVEDLCEYNAMVAWELERHQVAQTWSMLKMIYTTCPSTPTQGKHSSGKSDIYNIKDKDELKKQENKKDQHQDKTEDADFLGQHERNHGNSSGGTEDDSDGPDGDVDAKGSSMINVVTGLGAHIQSQSDFFFGDGEIEQNFEYDNLGPNPNNDEWQLPNEAFQPRHDIEDHGNSLDPIIQSGDSPSSANESEFNVAVTLPSVAENVIRQEIISARPFQSDINTSKYASTVADMLHFYADQGDVQTAVCVLIVLGDRIRHCIDELAQEQWYMSYIDLLGRFKLWSEANEVIKLCHIHPVASLNQMSTKIKTNCTDCSKEMTRCGWVCDKPPTRIHTCTICHHPAKGLFVWCQGCSHGGHLEHMKDWFDLNPQCPAGCGHLCEWL